jgi:hypothetical protein
MPTFSAITMLLSRASIHSVSPPNRSPPAKLSGEI